MKRLLENTRNTEENQWHVNFLRIKSTYPRGEEIPSVNPIVFGVVGLTQRAVDEQGVQRHHRGEDEVVQHDAHQVQVLHLKYFIK
jgi:hypothetical protein